MKTFILGYLASLAVAANIVENVQAEFNPFRDLCYKNAIDYDFCQALKLMQAPVNVDFPLNLKARKGGKTFKKQKTVSKIPTNISVAIIATGPNDTSVTTTLTITNFFTSSSTQTSVPKSIPIVVTSMPMTTVPVSPSTIYISTTIFSTTTSATTLTSVEKSTSNTSTSEKGYDEYQYGEEGEEEKKKKKTKRSKDGYADIVE
ncbi:hypothetical protein AX774_g5846 [Zancudomyces culisetae]|uniref:Uncharacterized protein n=1 Tax=Zancudomyces culisetae TaxID=1213189 RepID=A0A1R1PIC3_ZANCU|nr:hypothetical protein AX774_g5846 [Zancudomyces culisetae]|eukprot:OMH80707.1 hypothetical protein AX774_g5846 [Zancudomyces culisetae]